MLFDIATIAAIAVREALSVIAAATPPTPAARGISTSLLLFFLIAILYAFPELAILVIRVFVLADKNPFSVTIIL